MLRCLVFIDMFNVLWKPRGSVVLYYSILDNISKLITVIE